MKKKKLVLKVLLKELLKGVCLFTLAYVVLFYVRLNANIIKEEITSSLISVQDNLHSPLNVKDNSDNQFYNTMAVVLSFLTEENVYPSDIKIYSLGKSNKPLDLIPNLVGRYGLSTRQINTKGELEYYMTNKDVIIVGNMKAGFQGEDNEKLFIFTRANRNKEDATTDSFFVQEASKPEKIVVAEKNEILKNATALFTVE